MGDPPISLQRPFEWTFKGGHFSHSPIQFVGEETDLNISLEISTTDTPPDWDIQINGQLDAGAVSKLMPGAEISFSGSSVIDIELTYRNGALIGQASVNGGRIRFADPPLTISQVQAQLTANGQILEIVNLKGQVGSGKLEGSGQLQFENIGTLPKADLKFTIERVPLTLSEGIYALISGEVRLQGDSQGYTIGGDIIIPRLLYNKEMDSTSESLSQLDRQLKLLEGRSSLSDLITLDLTTQIQDLHIENSLAQLSAGGALSISGSLSNPELKGSISVQGGGLLKLGRARVQISEGRVILNNYPESQLELDISGITRISGVFIELRVQGQLDNLQTQLQAPYRSDLTHGDLVMLIMTGRTSQAAVDEAGTVAVEGLAGALGDVLQEGVGESVYIDVSPDQSFFSYDTDPTTWFSLGKEVAPNIYVIYSQDLGSTRRRGVIAYMPKELPIQLRYIGEEDGRKMLEANHRLGINFRKKQERGDASRKPLRINQLSFEGPSPITDKDLRKLAKLKSGNKYDHWKTLQGAERIRTRLLKLGYRGARVELEATPSGPEQTDITYFIESGKHISIVWKGDQIKGKIRKDIEALWDSTTPEDILAETLRQKTVYALQAQRFYLAQVEVNRTNKEEEITVEFQVKKGPQGQRLVLQFEGNEVLSDKELAEALPSPSKPLFFETIDGDASSLRNILRVLYASEGYLQIEVNPVETEYNEQNREYLVAVPVEEGTLSTVSNIFMPQELTDAKGPDVPDFQLRVGHPFRIEEYINDRSVLSRYYRGQGYPESRVTGILEPTEDEVAVTFKVTKN
ncbi:translocation/assembly module TamB domain-containing protein, partial [bacterium]|nr:translocation/assembly module TamB domain-containing protein [bacterium]